MKKGFTIIELMTVVMIIGLLSAIAVGVLNISRAKSRDAKRISDVQVIRAALEQYWLRNASYPAVASMEQVGTGAYTILGSNGFEASPGTGTVYLRIPAGPDASEYYGYESTISTGYALEFITERATDLGPAGTYYAHGNGAIDGDASSK